MESASRARVQSDHSEGSDNGDRRRKQLADPRNTDTCDFVHGSQMSHTGPPQIGAEQPHAPFLYCRI